MSISLQSANTVLNLVNSTVTAAKSAVELAKKSKDSELRDRVSEVLDGILDLKSTVLSLEDEIRELKAKAAERGTISRNAEFGYWYREGESEPLCPRCYEGSDKVVYLAPLRSGSRKCRVCGWHFSESSSNGTTVSPRVSISQHAKPYWDI